MRRLHLLVAGAIYIFVLHLAYVYLTAPYFSYVGLSYSPVSSSVVVWSWFIALLPVAWLPISTPRPSLVVYYLLYTLVIVPASIVPAYIGALPIASLLRLQISLGFCFVLLGLVYRIPLSPLPRIRLSKMTYFVILALLSCASYLTIMHFVGFSFRFPNPFDVYGVRDDFNELTAAINSRWLGYCANWQAFVINPFLMAYGLIEKKYYVIAAALACQLAIYALGGLKMVLFSSALVLALLVIQKCRHFGVAFLASASLFVASCIIVDYFVWHTSVGLTSLFVRRMVFLPGQLTGMFFDFFSNNRFALLGHSVLKGVVTYPYSLEPPYLIGETYFSHDKMAADANIWGDGFANFGYFGMLGATLILGCWVWLVDSSSINRNRELIMLMVGVPSVVLANCGLLTSIGNHGLGLTLALIYLLPAEFGSGDTAPDSANAVVAPYRPATPFARR
jgi:hypothetical protein